jgi:hypothetical protein
LNLPVIPIRSRGFHGNNAAGSEVRIGGRILSQQYPRCARGNPVTRREHGRKLPVESGHFKNRLIIKKAKNPNRVIIAENINQSIRTISASRK